MLTSDVNMAGEDLQWCDTCREHKDGHCDGCKQRFLQGERTYRSQTFHVHPGAVGGVAGVRTVQKELCVDCYRLDFEKAYPGAKAPDLPDRGVDPKFHAGVRAQERRAQMNRMIEQLSCDPATGAAVLSPKQIDMLKRVTDIGLRFM